MANWEHFLVDNFAWVTTSLFAGIGAHSVYRRYSQNRSGQKVLNKTLMSGATIPATLHPLIHTEKCIGCTSCVKACPESGVLAMIDGKATLVGPSKCVGHGECEVICPEKAIDLVFGTSKIPYEIPEMNASYETRVSGLYIAGELGGMGLIRNATKQGVLAIESICRFLGQRSNGDAQQANVYDVVIVGAGPAGMAAALKAKEKGLRFIVLEQDRLGGTIAHYPRKKLVMSAPLELPLVGRVKFKSNYVSKEELLELWTHWQRHYSLPMIIGEKVEDVQKADNGIFQIKSSKRKIQSKKVVLCLGVGGTPRKLGIDGESESHYVFYRLSNPDDFKKSEIIVVGGGNSAAECACSLASADLGNKVNLLVRGKTMDRANEDNIAMVEKLQAQGVIKVFYETEVKKLDQNNLTFSHAGQEAHIKADAIFALIGQERPFGTLKSWGINTKKYFAQSISLFALIFFGWGCQPERPAAEGLVSPIKTFSHEGLTDNCLSCHEKDRPGPSHYSGQDCVSCHTVTGWKAEVKYSHVPLPSSCTKCHEIERPKADHGQGMDCVSCHNPSKWGQEIMYSHSPKPESCNKCHEQKRPTLDHGQKLDCIQCHQTTKWGRDHFYAHNPDPKQCQNCHETKRPLKTFYPEPEEKYKQGHFEDKDCFECHKSTVKDHKWIFDHANAKDKNIEYCMPCHLERGKKKHFYGGMIGWFKGEGKCFECHNIRHSWDEGKNK